MKTIQLQGQLRTDFGKSASRKIRAQQYVPGVLYGQDDSTKQALHFSVPAKDMRPLVYTSDFQLVTLNLEGKAYRCVLKDLQFDKVSDELIHFDLLALSDDKKVEVSIPIRFEGTPEGVLVGGKMVVKMKALKVKTLPQYLQDNIVVPLASLKLNESIRVEQVKIPHYEILNAPRIPIVSVVLTRQLKQQDSEAKKAVAEEKKAADKKG